MPVLGGWISTVFCTSYNANYDWSTYKWCDGSKTTLTKYCTDSSYGSVDDKTKLEISDDVANVIWGGRWRMPTIEELEELINGCVWEWTWPNGILGYTITSKRNGRSIFLPAAGGFETKYGEGRNGAYYTANLEDNHSVYILHFVSMYIYDSTAYRCDACSVRPVMSKK